MTCSKSLALLAILTVLILTPLALPATPPECANPGEIPTRLLTWTISPPLLGYDLALAHEYVFITDGYNPNPTIIRYPLNGGSPISWDVDSLQQPDDIEINPINDYIYVAGFTDDPRVHAYDFDGVRKKVLFDGPPGGGPGEFAGAGFPIAIHPTTGDLYVVDQDSLNDGQSQVWVSRIQRFDADGNFDYLIINNGLGYDPIEDNGQPPIPPACGAWHYPKRLKVDADGSVYLMDFIDFNGTMVYIHKFDSTGACVENFEITGSGFRVDPDGFVYLYSDSLRKLNPTRTETLYTIGALSSPISRAELLAGSSDFLCLVSPGQPYELEILGKDIETLNILNTDWQDPVTFQLRTDSLSLLSGCPPRTNPMAGVVADGVSPLLLRWRLLGPGEVTWELVDQQLPAVTSGLGTVSTIDGLISDTLSVTTTVELVDGE